MTELQVGFVFNLLTKPPPQKSSYVLTSLMAQSANARLRVEENELPWVIQAGAIWGCPTSAQALVSELGRPKGDWKASIKFKAHSKLFQVEQNTCK